MKEKEKKKQIIYPVVPPNFGIPLTDPLGSYTGVPVIPDEVPVQDADDL